MRCPNGEIKVSRKAPMPTMHTVPWWKGLPFVTATEPQPAALVCTAAIMIGIRKKRK